MSGGLNKLDKHTGKFTVYAFSKNDTAGISSNTIWKLAVDSSNHIWAETKKGINVLNTETNRFKHCRYSKTDKNTISSDMVISVFVDREGEVWCGTLSGLDKYNRSSDDFHRYGRSLSGHKIWAISQNPFGEILFGSNKGVWVQDANDGDSFNCICDNSTIHTIWYLLPIDEKIWAGTNTGLWIFDNLDNSCSKVQNNFLEPGQHEGNTWSVIKDNAGIIWSGNDDGVLKLRPGKGRFKSIKSNSDKPLHLSNNSVNAILVDKDNTLWVGTDGGGLNVLDKGSQEFRVIRKNDLDQNSISGNNIWALMQDDEGLIWIGTYGAGLISFNTQTGQFTKYKADRNNPEALSNTRVLALLEDSQGKIWIGTRGGGLNIFDKQTGKFTVFLHDPDDSTSISSNTVLSLLEDPQGNIVIGTFEGGLSIFSKKKNIFRNFKNNPSNPNSISNNNVWGVMFDSNNRLWLGTQGGLNFTDYNLPTLIFNHFEIASGLPSNFVFGLEEDRHGNIWISTFKGLARLNNSVFRELIKDNPDLPGYKNNPFDPLFKIFDESNGISGNEFNQGAYFKSEDGTIYFGGMSGLTYFHPDSVQVNEFEPNVILSGFKIFNKDVGIIPPEFEAKTEIGEVVNINGKYFIPQKITYLDELVLTYKESVFSFEFASLDYTMPEKNQYAYKMENFDPNWNYVTDQNSATYTNLDAGDYIFRVKGTNSDGKWSRHEVKLKITIVPPFWDTVWFKVVSISALLLIVVLIIYRIFQEQKRKALAEKEKMELQLKTIKNQIDPHFAFNAINMIGSLVYKGNPDTVYDYFSRFARLIRSTLEDSEKIARPLGEELDFVKNYVEIQKARFKDKFDFVLNVDKGTELSIEVPKMIIQTHVENAIKHGLMHKKEKGELTIDIIQESNELRIAIKDNGIGRKEAAVISKGSTGKGMQIIEQIFSLYNKLTENSIHQQIIDLKDESGNANGTEVILIVRLNQ
jgi:ligand-binding sensor domain-containing protein